MWIQFTGGAGTVTGSRFLVETSGGTRVLVDCGLFQGVKHLRSRNWAAPPFDPASIDAVVLTHAHIDHSGWLPVLIGRGFTGPIYATEATTELCAILLRDSGHLQEEEARYANKRGFSKHDPAKPLYTAEDGERALSQFRPLGVQEPHTIGDMEVRLQTAGHILGATSVRIRADGREILFSGDLGRPWDPILPPPDPPGSPDVVVMESTYGDRLHDDADPVEALGALASRALERGGVVLIPAFAVGRTQAILWAIHQLFESGRLPRVPVYLNSPMAQNVTDLFTRVGVGLRLGREELAALHQTARFVRTVDASKALNEGRGPMIILSASGMLTGGRVVHHLKAFGPDPKNLLLLCGFQAPGTRGGAIVAGATQVRIHGAYVPIRAEVAVLDGFSAHADQEELLGWIGGVERPPERVILVHGEPAAADALRCRIAADHGWEVHVAQDGERVELGTRHHGGRG